jgi:IS5 family transposase
VIVNEKTAQIIATAFAQGSVHDFQLFKSSRIGIFEEIECLADAGYQGLTKQHTNSQTPKKKSKHHPLTPEQKAANRELARQRIVAEHVIGRLKVFRILSERYRNRRKRFGLRFNLIAAIYNFELDD